MTCSKSIYSHIHLAGFPKRRGRKGLIRYPCTPRVVARLRNEGESIDAFNIDMILEDQIDAGMFAKGIISLDCSDLPGGLWAHQKTTITWGRKIHRGLVWAPMGHGKTLIGATMAAGRKALILCPKYVIPIWQAALPGASIKDPEADIFICSYERIWRKGLSSKILSQTWDVVIADEVQRLKGHSSKQSKFASKIEAQDRIGLSGIPYPNSPLDYFGIWRFIDPGILGLNWTNFEDRYAVKVKEHIIVQYKNIDELKAKTDPYTCKIKDVDLDLPPLTKTIIPVTLSAWAMRLYKPFAKSFVMELKNGTMTAGNALVKTLKCQMFTSGIAKTDEGKEIEIDKTKQKALEELLDESRDQKVVIFGRFCHDMVTAKRACKATGRR